MNEEIRDRKQSIGIEWIRAASGTTYLCPVGQDLSSASEEELRRLCVNESENPQND